MRAEKLFNYIKVTDKDCWEWQGTRQWNGYGRVGMYEKYYMAHRLFFELFVEEIGDGKVIMHLCDNPPCVNPNHLRQGTQKDNNRDAFNKNRNVKPVGENAPWSKLTKEKVRQIRKEKALNPRLTYVEMAPKYGVGKDTIRLVCLRKRWGHIE